MGNGGSGAYTGEQRIHAVSFPYGVTPKMCPKYKAAMDRIVVAVKSKSIASYEREAGINGHLESRVYQRQVQLGQDRI